jgi:hypothetical protein
VTLLDTDASVDAGRLADLGLELMAAFRHRQNQHDLHTDGTGPRNTGNYRVTQYNLREAMSAGEVTWLLSTRSYMAEVAKTDNPAALRRALVLLGGEVIAWINDLDNRKE